MTPEVLHAVATRVAGKPIFTKERCAVVACVVVGNVIVARFLGPSKPTIQDSIIFVLMGFAGFFLPALVVGIIRIGYKNYDPNYFKKQPRDPISTIKSIFQRLVLYIHSTFLTIVFLFICIWLVLALIAPYLERASF